jgi:hypothetical protein
MARRCQYAQRIRIVTTRRQYKSRYSLAKAGWWSRLVVTAVFVFYTCYIPIHLATEMHLDDVLASLAHGRVHNDVHDDADHGHDNGGDSHTPHPASDHQLNLTASTQSSSAVLAILLLPAVTSVLISEPEPQPRIPIYEHSRPPGESPPDPLQPRAPPLA